MTRGAVRSALLLLLASTTAAAQRAPARADSMAVTVRELETHLRELSSDRYEGRFPGTRAETLTTTYLTRQLRAAGVRPGVNGAWLQRVDLLRHQPDPGAPVEARLSGRVTRALEHGRDLRLANATAGAEVAAGGELVFVGYGIDAPVYRWNDLAGVDLRGKVAVALAGEPSLPGDTVRFNGPRASRYASARDRQRELGRRGAVGVLWVTRAPMPRTPPGGLAQRTAQASSTALRFTGSVSAALLEALLPAGAPPLAELTAAAQRPGFRALPLGARLDVRFRTRPSVVPSHNVIGVVPGRDARLRAEHVVLSAHWDAYGVGVPVNGDSIYNGALDDGSGLTELLALARVFAAHPQRRSVTFLFTTAEEMGLLGAEAFACEGPLAPERMAANLNVDDGLELWGVKRDAAPLGVELSTLGRTAADVAARMGLRMTPDPFPEEGFFLRADNLPFAKVGVPALYMALGTDAVGRPAGWVAERTKEYEARHYHKPSDDYDTVVVDLEGARQMAEFVRDVTIAVANADERPRWNAGAEFRRLPAGRRCG